MPSVPPLTSSASRDLKRPRPLPTAVRQAIVMMVRGLPDDEDQRPLSFIAAAKAAGIRPDTMRRYLDRPEVIAMLRRERRAYREALCGGNEGALATIRDASKNDMARVAAVRQLEAMNAEETTRPPDDGAPRFQINIVEPSPPLTVIESRTIPAPYVAGEPEPVEPKKPEPDFRPHRP